ncbi:MAG: CHAT domain-containing protein [Roseovarius sp.]
MRPRAGLALVAALVCLLAALAPATAQTPAREPSGTLAALNRATLEALGQQDTALALARARAAVEKGRQLPAPEPTEFAFALNNLGYTLGLAGEAEAAEKALGAALAHAEAEGLTATEPWFLALANRANLRAAGADGPGAEADALRLLEAARGTAWHGRALGNASAMAFQRGDYPRAVAYLEELIAVEPQLLANSFGAVFTAYAEAQGRAEEAGETDAALALLTGRLAIVRHYLPPADAREPAQLLLWQKFFQLHQSERYGEAADALRAWAAEGPLPEAEQAYLEEMATLTLTATQLSSYSERREVQLPYAELAAAFAELAGGPDDPRLGLALREVAAAEGNLGRHAEAAATLERAARILRRTPEGRQSLHLLLDDLAANAWLRGELALAETLFAQSSRAYEAALAEGAPPLEPIDMAIQLTTRARLQVDLGAPEEALALTEEARRHFDEDAARGAQKWNSRAQAMRIHNARALAFSDLGQREAALSEIDAGLAVARTSLPTTHPDLALALVNAADLLMVNGAESRAMALLEEGIALYRTALPEGVPIVADAEATLAFAHLARGAQAPATDLLRRVTAARKLPAYKHALPEASAEFEALAWLLLDGPEPPGRATLDEALAALQWTQVTRSAEALAMMEARLALDDPLQGVWLRRRQDLREAHQRTFSQLLASYAEAEAEATPRITALEARQTALEAQLAETEAQLFSLGLETTGITGVEPLALAEMQALLGPGEVLVTFLLPGLRPDLVAGLDSSSNHAIAITADTVQVARIPETSRNALNLRIEAFRCSVAASDPGCGPGAAPALRGAFSLDAPETTPETTPEGAFDFATAHALYTDLFGGIEPALEGATHLLIAPPADLLRLPFQALVTTPGAQSLGEADWLIRRHSVSVLPSLTSLRALRGGPVRPAPALGRMLGMGDPVIGAPSGIACESVRVADLRSAAEINAPLMAQTGDALPLARVEALRSLPRLPDAVCELEAIGRVFGPENTALHLGADATETRIKALDASGALAGYNVLVFATHGLTAGETGANAPGLVLTPPATASLEDDGLLTAAEIAALSLDARLVVLSACNTAAGETPEAEGLSGLARAFFHAGAQTLLVTHWSVYSAAAVEVSTGLFQALEAHPDGPHAAALRRSILAILDDPAADPFRKHPSYWAPFAVIGAN